MIELTALAQGAWWGFMGELQYQRALLGGIAIALACSTLSVLVVLKRMAMIGEGIAHGAFGGVGLAMLLQIVILAYAPALANTLRLKDEPELFRDCVIAAFCVGSALLIGWMSRRSQVTEDSAIGIALVAAMALGFLLMNVRDQLLGGLLASGRIDRGLIGYNVSYESILFGDLLVITRTEIVLAWVLAGGVLAWVLAAFKEIVFFTFDEEAAAVFGVRTGLLYNVLLVLLGLAVVAAIRMLGVVLAGAILILPGATARMWSRHVGRVMLISIVIGVAALVGGLLLAEALGDLGVGPVIVAVLAAAFGVSYVVRGKR
jgi:zinc transport system permease protein